MKPIQLLVLLPLAVTLPSLYGGQPAPDLVKDIQPGSVGAIPDFSRPLVLGNKLIFAANDGKTGYELWESDGTAAGTRLLKDIVSGAAGSYPSGPVGAGNHMYFKTSNSSGSPLGIWKTDGTAAGTTKMSNMGTNPLLFGSVGNTLYFYNTTVESGFELWKTDGTAAGTMIVSDLTPGTASSSLTAGIGVGSYYYFVSHVRGVSVSLWRTDGTSAGTTLIKSLPNGSGFSGFTVVGNDLYFGASDGIHGHELWKSDGTAAGTFMLKDLAPGPDNGISSGSLTEAGGLLYFCARLDDRYAVWRSDGTEAGTFPLLPIVNPINSKMLVMGNEILFSAHYNGKAEVWRSNGTVAGTFPFKPGMKTGLGFILKRGSTWYFGSSELWQSDGTPDGTRSVADWTSSYSQRALLGDKIYVSANLSPAGHELHAYDLTPPSIAKPELTERTKTSMKVSTAIHGNGFASTAALEYGLTETYGTTVTIPLGTEVANQFQPVEITLSDLSPGSAYHYRITATSTKGSRISTGTFDTLYTREDWRMAHFGMSGNTGVAADDADPDGDGVSNLVEYAFGLTPSMRDASKLPQSTRNSVNDIYSFTSPPGREDVTCGLEVSFTLEPGSWQAVESYGKGRNHAYNVQHFGIPRRFTRWTANPR
ncbi:hypothetical protein OKA04_04475 [Luteolibacter flavescens]|uniref:Fibronectin type-III domain-containing protein n=1 Tax=Luteolibacter flavescens TaxID=1859460 RepID=A0ABT3FL46_9BACT|nr:ELWxxDGT repeat protein [Luteolibacter flavescens]MCW1883971.1 hypothetical protein [Luteolibacter flavescens]